MSWMESLLLGTEITGDLARDHHVNQRLQSLATGTDNASRSLGSLQARLQGQERELAEMRLAMQALTRFLVEKRLLSQDELRDYIREVDAEDGVVDGQLQPTSRKPQFKPGGLPPNAPRGSA